MFLVWLGVILLIVALAVVLFIILHKMPLLANIDVDNLPAEQATAKKSAIINNRIRRQLARHGWWWRNILSPIYAKIQGFFGRGYAKLQRLHRQQVKTKLQLQGLNEQRANELLLEANEALSQGRVNEAEQLALESLELDQRQIDGFAVLAEVYNEAKKYKEAQEVWQYIIKRLTQKYRAEELRRRPEAKNTKQKLADYYYLLGQSYYRNDQLDRADHYLRQALKLAPKNPRYLDTMLAVSIMRKDRVTAVLILDTLTAVDPNNGNLSNYLEQIKQL
jgi:Tfp pilus assembly protein PilF